MTTYSTDQIDEGTSNYYWTDARFDDRLAIKTTSQVDEGSNLYWTQARFDNSFANKTTTELNEGTSNLYWTVSRFDDRLDTKTTSQLAEGSNLYYTEQRVIDVFNTQLSDRTTDQVAEGTSNLYYTTQRVVDDVSDLFASGGLTTSQVIEGSNLYWTNDRFDVRYDSKSTDNVNEGSSNLYWTPLRFDLRLASKSTDNVNEGSNNLYWTDNRFDDRLATKTTSQLEEGSNLYYTEARVIGVFNSNLSVATTDQVAEGTSNFYWTETRFNTSFGNKTTDDLTEGIHNKYIIDNLYNNDMWINGTLTTSNLSVIGTYTQLDTVSYATEKMEIVNEGSGPALFIKQSGFHNVFEVYDENTLSFMVADGGNVGIRSSAPAYELDVLGTVRAIEYIGIGSNLTNVYLGDKTTSEIAEGSNLYWTNSRFDTRLATKDTDDLSEGTTNLYWTNSRFDTRLATKLSTKDTDNLSEGTTNLYYTTTRANTDFDTRLATKDTDDLSEGTNNLYYTTNRFAADFDTRLASASNSLLGGSGGTTVSGWNGATYTGFKTTTPFYIGLYLSTDYGGLNANNNYALPFIVDTSGSQTGYRAASTSTNASSYWKSGNSGNCFVPPVSGIYSVDYTVVSETNGSGWVAKDSTSSSASNKMFGGFYFESYGEVASTHVTLLTTTADEWYFMVRHKSNGYSVFSSYNVNEHLSHTEAHILLLQETD